MKTIEYKSSEPRDWPSGPWDDEPDKIQFEEPETGLPAIARRNQQGAWCGYVAVSEGHPWYGADYWADEHLDKDIVEIVDVHGGVTYAGATQGKDSVLPNVQQLSLSPSDEKCEGLWWFGFDCAHYGDTSPAYDWSFGGEYTYRTLDFVKAEITKLARQVAAASGAEVPMNV